MNLNYYIYTIIQYDASAVNFVKLYDKLFRSYYLDCSRAVSISELPNKRYVGSLYWRS